MFVDRSLAGDQGIRDAEAWETREIAIGRPELFHFVLQANRRDARIVDGTAASLGSEKYFSEKTPATRQLGDQ